jgi:surfeit locus 1 family protein
MPLLRSSSVVEERRGRTRTQAKIVAVAAVLTAVCVAAGVWQLARLQQKRDRNAALRAGLASAPLIVDGRFSAGADPEALRYHRATATGVYDVAHEVVLFGRTQDGQAGNHVLTPLVLTDGSAIVVDRGWVPLALDDPPIEAATPPAGSVSVEGVLLGSEGGLPADADRGVEPVTTLARSDLAALQAQLPYPIAPVTLLLREQDPAARELPRPAPLPELSEGPHLSYAIQWFCFATIAVIGGVILLRRERAEPADEDAAPTSEGPGPG